MYVCASPDEHRHPSAVRPTCQRGDGLEAELKTSGGPPLNQEGFSLPACTAFISISCDFSPHLLHSGANMLMADGTITDHRPNLPGQPIGRKWMAFGLLISFFLVRTVSSSLSTAAR